MKNEVIEDYPPSEVMKLTADKLTMKLPKNSVPKEFRTPILHHIKEVADSRGGTNLRSVKKAFKHRYRIPFVCDDGTFAFILIEYVPVHPHRAKYALRIEFNPNKLGAKGCAAMRVILKEMFGENFLQLASSLVVTDVDWCIDLFGLSSADVVMHTAEKHVFTTFGKTSGKDSEPECWYFGSPTSDYQLRVYDKHRELMAAFASSDKKMRLKIKDVTEKMESMPRCMRVEASLKNMDLHPSELHTLKNPFQPLQIFNLPRLSDSPKTDFDRLFIDSVRLHGLSAALVRIRDTTVRRRVMRGASTYRVDWWQPEKLGSQIQDAIHRLDILPSAAFEQKLESSRQPQQPMQVGPQSTIRKLPATQATRRLRRREQQHQSVNTKR